MTVTDRIRNLSSGQRSSLLERLGHLDAVTGAEKEIVAYVVQRAGTNASPDDLRSFCSSQLPAFMVPAQFVTMDHLPLQPNGKIDRHALPAPDAESPATSPPPRTDAETRLAKIWSDLLQVGSLGVHDNFFRLGGHSLLALQVMARVREVFQVDLPLKALFDGPTVAALARAISNCPATSSQPIRKITRSAGLSAPDRKIQFNHE
jgi:acyl carrier protein